MNAPFRRRAAAAAGPCYSRSAFLILALGIILLILHRAIRESTSLTSKTTTTTAAAAAAGGGGRGIMGMERKQKEVERQAAQWEAERKQREGMKGWSWQKAREERRKWQGNEAAGIGATGMGASGMSAQEIKWAAIAEQQLAALEERKRRENEFSDG